jgi:hypothetical protein
MWLYNIGINRRWSGLMHNFNLFLRPSLLFRSPRFLLSPVVTSSMLLQILVVSFLSNILISLKDTPRHRNYYIMQSLDFGIDCHFKTNHLGVGPLIHHFPIFRCVFGLG